MLHFKKALLLGILTTCVSSVSLANDRAYWSSPSPVRNHAVHGTFYPHGGAHATWPHAAPGHYAPHASQPYQFNGYRQGYHSTYSPQIVPNYGHSYPYFGW